MEDDDEFGDLYTDVLQSFESSSQPQPPPPPPVQQQQQSLPRTIDLNLKTDEDGEILPLPPANSQTLAPAVDDPLRDSSAAAAAADARVSDAKERFQAGDAVSAEKEVNFDIEEEADDDGGGMGLDAVIPGLSGAGEAPAVVISNQGNAAAANVEGSRREEDGWDSDDSEDDLQIVLNDNNLLHGGGPMGGGEEDEEGGGGGGGEVLGAEGELHHHQPGADEQEWVEDGAQAADGGGGERKEMMGGEAAGKPAAAMLMAPKVGYSSHGYHPLHSQYKYVRPGAVPMSGPINSGPGGVSGQVRPLGNVGPLPGRGRGDWRPTGLKGGAPLQKNFHSGFGTPGWGNNMGGRGFGGGGLEFTLPSHKTIFEVDIDGFEEKPWKYSGVDISDYFNFGLNEDSWKDYCKQLEQLRLESTMQSKIRVYESTRTEQEYDPDLPPELAAATGMNDFPAEHANLGKSEGGQSDFTKGSVRMRPPFPSGRAIQVESGYGVERFPSSENRPQRMRDVDAVIEIVLQGSLDDDSPAGNGTPDSTEIEPSSEDFGRSAFGDEDPAQDDKAHVNGFPQALQHQKDPLGRKRPSDHTVPKDDGVLPFPPDVPVQHSGSEDQTLGSAGGSFGENRGTQRRVRDRSPRLTQSQSARDKKEGSLESVDRRRSPLISSPVSHGAAGEASVDRRDDDQDEPLLGDESSGMEKEEEVSTTLNDDVHDRVADNQILGSRDEQSADDELDDGEDSKAARSGDNSKARSGSSRDYQKRRNGAEEEVIQGRSAHLGGIKSPFDEKEQGFQRRNRDGRQEPDRSHMVVKGREGSFPYRDWDPSSTHHLQLKNDGPHRRKERENLDGAWQRRDDDPYSRRIRPEEPRKRERSDDMGSRHRSKVRESERSDKDEYMMSRKQLDNGNYRVFYDKDVGSRPRDREDSLKGRHEQIDDYHGKRRKDEEYLRRDLIDKEELLHGHRDNTSRRKRERDEISDQRKRDDHQLNARDNLDGHHSVRHRDELWLQRDRGDRQRERDEWHMPKQSHEENILPKRERDEGRVSIRGGRAAEDKAWGGHAKDENKGSDKEHQYKETVRHSDTSKRRDRVEEETSHHRGREDVHARGNHMNNDERRSGKERSSTRNERVDSQKVHDRKHKDNSRRKKETEVVDIDTSITAKRHHEDQRGRSKEMGMRGTREQEGPGHSFKRHREDASYEDEQQDLKKGRSKLERWTSHKERDFDINNKPSSTSKIKEPDSGFSDASKLPDASSKPEPVEHVDNQHSLAEENAAYHDMKDAADTKPSDTETTLEGRHLDTVEKLKKRSERFKLPLPNEKETSTVKKIESEVLPSPNSDPPVVESEIKPERPARKRRWISN